MSKLQEAVLQGFMIFALTTAVAQIQFASARYVASSAKFTTWTSNVPCPAPTSYAVQSNIDSH